MLAIRIFRCGLIVALAVLTASCGSEGGGTKRPVAASCDTFAPLAPLRANTDWPHLKEASLVVYRSYRRGTWTGDDNERLTRCLAEIPAAASFRYALHWVFFEETTKALPSVHLRNELRRLSDTFFRSLSHRGKSGGFHRGRRSLFLDFAQIPPNEWDFIFIHEAAHGIDDVLPAAMEFYSDPDRVKRVAMGKEDPRPWLLAGLDRGFLAEVRAWTVTFAVYRTHRPATPIPWLETILAAQRPGEPLDRFVLRYLDARFVDPTEGIYSVPAIAGALRQLRADLSSGSAAVNWGRLLRYRLGDGS